MFKKNRCWIRAINRWKYVLIYEKGIRGGICNKVHSYAEANNKYMKNYDKNKESSFLIYVDANNCL